MVSYGLAYLDSDSDAWCFVEAGDDFTTIALA